MSARFQVSNDNSRGILSTSTMPRLIPLFGWTVRGVEAIIGCLILGTWGKRTAFQLPAVSTIVTSDAGQMSLP